MTQNNIAITAVSLIRSKEERKTTIESIEFLDTLNVPIVIVDGGSSKQDKKIIRQFSNVSFFEEKGLDQQLLRSQIEGAKKADYLFYLHLDKLDFIKKYAEELIDRYFNQSKSGMFVINRTGNAFNTYPKYQQMTELFLNSMMSEYVGIMNDYYYGPKIYPALLVKYIKNIQMNFGWGLEAYYYSIAKGLDMPFEFFSVKVKSPKEIFNEAEARFYRLRIIKWQIEGLFKGDQIIKEVKSK